MKRLLLSTTFTLGLLVLSSLKALSSPESATKGRPLLPPPPTAPNPVPTTSTFNSETTQRLTSTSTSSQSYRVLAIVGNTTQHNQVLSVFPEAFRTQHQGRSAMQIGRFADQTNAQQAFLQLQNLGLTAVVE